MTGATEIETLAATVRAGLDADERIARAVDDNSPPWDGRWEADENRALRTYNGWVLAYRDGREFVPGLVGHWVRHDPASVLRRVARDRAVVDLLLADPHADSCGFRRDDPDEWPCECNRDHRVTAYLTLLAQPYTEAT